MLYAGYAILIDLNVNEGFSGSRELLQTYDEAFMRCTARCMYEHPKALDSEGFMSAGYQCVALDVLKMHSIGLAGGDELDLLTVFRQLVLSELTYEHLMEIDSTTYRAIVERHLAAGQGDRTVQMMLQSLGSYALSATSEMPGTDHGVLGLAALKLIVPECVRNSAYGLHVAIVKYVGAAPESQIHHFFTMWFVDPEGMAVS